MSTDAYGEILIGPHQQITVDGLVHNDQTAALVATGDIEIEHGKLRWRTNVTGRLISALRSFQSYKDPMGVARTLVRRIEEVSNDN